MRFSRCRNAFPWKTTTNNNNNFQLNNDAQVILINLNRNAINKWAKQPLQAAGVGCVWPLPLHLRQRLRLRRPRLRTFTIDGAGCGLPALPKCVCSWWKLVCQSCRCRCRRRRCIHIFPSAFQSHTTRGINRPKERDTETVFDSKPSSPVQLHNQQDSFFYSFQTKTKPTIKMAFKVRKAKLARTKLRLSIYCSTLLCVCKCVWEQVICVPQELLRMCLHWIRGSKRLSSS